MRPLGLTDLEDAARLLRLEGTSEIREIAIRLDTSEPKMIGILASLDEKLQNPWYFLTPDTADALSAILSPETLGDWRNEGRSEPGLLEALARDRSLSFDVLTVLPAMNEARLAQVAKAVAHFGDPDAHDQAEIDWLTIILEGHSTSAVLAAVRQRDKRRRAA